MKDLLKSCCGFAKTGFNYLEKWQLARALELAVLTVLSFAAGRLLSYFIGWGDSYFSGFWIIMVALLVTKDEEVELGDLQWRLFAIALGVAAGFVMISVFSLNFVSLFLSVVLVAWACTFFNWHRFQQISILALTALMVSNYLQVDMILWAGAVGRILEAAIAMGLAYGVHVLFNSLRNCCDTHSSASHN